MSKKMNPAFARKLLLSIGQDPDEFIRTAESSEEAAFLIEQAIRSRDKFYHPDVGIRKNSSDYQEWSKVKHMVEQFPAREIFRSLKYSSSSKRHHQVKKAVDEVQEKAQEEISALAARFSFGTYQRELEENLVGTYFILRSPHLIYNNHVLITPEYLAEHRTFQDILESERERRLEEYRSTRASKLEAKIQELNDRIKGNVLGNFVWEDRTEDLQILKGILSRAKTPQEVYGAIKEYHDVVESEIMGLGYEGLLERLRDAHDQRTLERIAVKRETSRKIKNVSNKYTAKIVPVKDRILQRRKSELKIGKVKRAKDFKSLQKAISNDPSLEEVIERMGFYQELSVLNTIGEMDAVEEDKEFYSGVENKIFDQLKRRFNLSRDDASSLARDMVTSARNGLNAPKLKSRFQKLARSDIDRSNISDLMTMVKYVRKMRDEIKQIREDERTRFADEFSVINRELLGTLPPDLSRSYLVTRRLMKKFLRTNYFEAVKTPPQTEMEEYEFAVKRNDVFIELVRSIGNFKKHIAKRDRYTEGLAERVEEIKEEKEKVKDEKPEFDIPRRQMMELFLREGPPLLRNIYREIKGPSEESTLYVFPENPFSLIYVDDGLRIHYHNLTGMEQDIPSIQEFEVTPRRVVGILNAAKLIQFVSNQEGKTVFLRGKVAKKIGGGVLSLDTIVRSQCYKDFLTEPGTNLSLLSVDSSQNQDLYRVEGQINSRTSSDLDDLLG